MGYRNGQGQNIIKSIFQSPLLPEPKWESTFFADCEAVEKDQFNGIFPYSTLVVGSEPV